MIESLQISSKTRIAEYNDLPHEAPHILKIAQECLAKENVLCSRHVFSWVVSIVCNDIKDIKHVKHKARVLFRHVAHVVLEHLHTCRLKLFALAKAVEYLVKL